METLAWTSHPLKLRKRAAVLVIVFIIIVLGIVFVVSGSVLMVLVGMLLFVGSLSTFFFPTHYELTRNRVRVRYLFTSVEKDLNHFRSFYPDKNGVLLSPFVRPSRLENFRGLYLRYHKNKKEVDLFIRRIFAERENGH